MANVTPEIQDRINDLARNLRALHLCASQEEAYERARQIILGSGAKDSPAPSIAQLLGELPPERPVDRMRDELQAVKEKMRKDSVGHAQTALEHDAASAAIKKAKQDVDTLSEFSDLLDDVQSTEERLAKEPQDTPVEHEAEPSEAPVPTPIPQPPVEPAENTQKKRDVRKEVKDILAEGGHPHLGDLEVVDVPAEKKQG